MLVLGVQMIGSGAKKAQKIRGDWLLSPCPLFSFFCTLFHFTPLPSISTPRTGYRPGRTISAKPIYFVIQSDKLVSFFFSSKAFSCMVPYLFRGLVYFFKRFLAYWEIMCTVSNIFCSVTSFIWKVLSCDSNFSYYTSSHQKHDHENFATTVLIQHPTEHMWCHHYQLRSATIR